MPQVDVAIVGGGITGLSAGLRLVAEGKTVALLEAKRLLSGETGRTSGHLTALVDGKYHKLIRDFGVDEARLVLRSSQEAIERIERNVSLLRIDCDFHRVSAYFYGEDEQQADEVRAEHEALQRLDATGISLIKQAPLPFGTKASLKMLNQARFQPVDYLLALTKRFAALGGHIYEQARVHDIEDGSPCRLVIEGPTRRDTELFARDVIVATDSPIAKNPIITTKVAAYQSYVMAIKPADGVIPNGLFFDAAKPYHYTRGYLGLAIVGGFDHKVGQGEENKSFEKLTRYCAERWPGAEISYRWSGELMEPVDGLPFIGLDLGARHIYVATGYSGNGLTFGTLAADLLADLIQGRPSAATDLFSAKRFKPLASAARYVSENKDFPLCMMRDRLFGLRKEINAEPGDGVLMRVGNEIAAVSLDERGEPQAVSAICPHMGCQVAWNSAERSWDCPCHGSRFAANGEVLHGPATQDLAPIALKPEIKSA